MRLLWQDRAAVTAGVGGQVLTLVLDVEEHSIRSNSDSSRHPGSCDWSSSGRSSPCGAGLLAGDDSTTGAGSTLAQAGGAASSSHATFGGGSNSSSGASDSEGDPGDMPCSPDISRPACQGSSAGSEPLEVHAAGPMVRVLLSSKQQVVLDAVVLLQPYLR